MKSQKSIFLDKEMTYSVLNSKKFQFRIPLKGKLKKMETNYLGRWEYKEKINRFKSISMLNYKYHDLIAKLIEDHSKYKKGDILWVREPSKVTYEIGNRMKFIYLADGKNSEVEIPKRFLSGKIDLYQGKPKWIYEHKRVPSGCIKEMSRIFLEVTSVRIERLNDITSEGIEKEGCCLKDCHIDGYSDETVKQYVYPIWWERVWNEKAKVGFKIKDNPFVFVYTFRQINS